MPERDRKNVSHHILPTSANLLGICFLIVTFIKASGLKNRTIIDDFAGLAIIIFLFASIFSYAAMRSAAKSEVYERVADLIFILGLGLMALATLIVAFEVII